jgi:hypothetical protein
MERLRKAQQDIDDKIVAALAAKAEVGDTTAIQQWADRSDGKLPTSIGGSTDVGPIRLVWPSGE